MERVRREWPYLLILAILALFIWLRDLKWATSSDDTLPILVALPLFVWMGAPWTLRENPQPFSVAKLAIAALLFLLGILFDNTLLLTIGWVTLLWTWITSRVDTSRLTDLRQLLILPFMAFPWVTLNADRVGWWFRLSGAWATAHFFDLLGYHVEREGTIIFINQLPVIVDAACSGLNTLQAMLIAGSLINYIMVGGTFLYWINLPLLVLLAWIANTARIIGISFAALLVSAEFATGVFHTWGGWAILMVMFIISMGCFSLEERLIKPHRQPG